ncbi:MAG: sulfite exporter TauE/SafE family protein [bacterium]|nr:sulfite exporter TauE/SafE family protein [bacterium]
MEHWTLIPIGACIATFASLIGIGGGLLWAPYLILVEGMQPQEAVIFSFMIQFVGMGSATFTNIRNKTIYWKLAVRLLPFIAIGLILGAVINQVITTEPQYLEMGLGVVSIIVSLFFAFQTERYDMHMTEDREIKPPLWLQGQSSLFGTISGIFSIGIGDFLIPVMRSKLKIPMPNAVGTSLFLNFALAFMGAIFHFVLSSHTFSAGRMELLIFSWVGVIIGGQIGPKLSTIIGDNRLKEMFVFALLLIGIHLIYHSMR